MAKLIGKYRNGNYDVSIYDDGTKARENGLSFFSPEFPESMDVKITDWCDVGCPFCSEGSTPNGAHADLTSIPFIDSLRPYTELAVGGGDPLGHPGLVTFLKECRRRKLIASVTVSQRRFMESGDLLEKMSSAGLLHGVGVSLADPTRPFVGAVSSFPNSVVHAIAGLVAEEQLEAMARKGVRLLILGYKRRGRGIGMYGSLGDRIDANIESLKETVKKAVAEGWFDVLSFDNLAISQLGVKDMVGGREWSESYMGDDGFASMFVDLVKGEFAASSASDERFPIGDDIVGMFEKVRIK